MIGIYFFRGMGKGEKLPRSKLVEGEVSYRVSDFSVTKVTIRKHFTFAPIKPLHRNLPIALSRKGEV